MFKAKVSQLIAEYDLFVMTASEKRILVLSVVIDCLQTACSRLYCKEAFKLAGLYPINSALPLSSSFVTNLSYQPPQILTVPASKKNYLSTGIK